MIKRPSGLAVLLSLTTSPWRAFPGVDAQVADSVSKLQDLGWIVRVATPHRYFLWRDGFTAPAVAAILAVFKRLESP